MPKTTHDVGLKTSIQTFEVFVRCTLMGNQPWPQFQNGIRERSIDHVGKRYVKERFPEVYKFACKRLGKHFENQLFLEEYSSDYPTKRGYNQLDNFKKLIKAYNGYDSDAVKYVEKVEAFIDKPLDELELEDVRAIRMEVKFLSKLDISVFYQLTGRLPHEGIEFKEEDFIIHFHNTFVAASIKLLGKTFRCKTNVL